MKHREEIMQILEAFDLTRSFRDAGNLAGCSPNTVALWVTKRDAGELTASPVRRPQLVDEFLPKLEEWMESSHGKVRADVVHDKLVAMGYVGSERTTRRAVAGARKAWLAGNRRVHRPWVAEPGLWFQWDFADGPLVTGVKAVLFCAWLAWSRFRVVLAIRDKTLPTVLACIDATLRRFGGCPTYALTDNEKTVTVEHVARIAIRNPDMVAATGHYGLTVATCLPADAPSKGGSEATVRVAKADLVPTDANLLAEYADWAALEVACESFCAEVNARPHRVTRRVPVEMLAEEQARLHRLPDRPFTAAFGQTRTVGCPQPMVALDWCLYSVPSRLAGETVWVRRRGEEVIITHLGVDGPAEVARHPVTTPGNPRVDAAHFPPAPEGPLERTPVPANAAEAEFLAIGHGAALWLKEAGAVGATRVRAKMADSVAMAKLSGKAEVDWALGHAAVYGRFAEGDLASIIAHRGTRAEGEAARASEAHSLQPGTEAWKGFGR
ncbi:MAG: IS21 family transposase [Actinomycetota bacterium]|nr:IS21 family transposase [Actinomycetota bacterium]MDQ3680841.1 IS21 family transposase [Actinomycetota bacterium]